MLLLSYAVIAFIIYGFFFIVKFTGFIILLFLLFFVFTSFFIVFYRCSFSIIMNFFFQSIGYTQLQTSVRGTNTIYMYNNIKCRRFFYINILYVSFEYKILLADYGISEQSSAFQINQPNQKLNFQSFSTFNQPIVSQFSSPSFQVGDFFDSIIQLVGN